MGYFFKKSKDLGLFKLNFSKSGIGISTGVKGLRVGLGPKGAYVHAGRGGLYYRKNLGNINNEMKNENPQNITIQTKPANIGDIDITGNDFDITQLAKMLDVRRQYTTPLGVTSCLFTILFWPIAFITTPIWVYFRKFPINITYFLFKNFNKEKSEVYKNFIEAFNTMEEYPHTSDIGFPVYFQGKIPEFCKINSKNTLLPCLSFGPFNHMYFAPEHFIVQTNDGVVVTEYKDLGEFNISIYSATCKNFDILGDEEILDETWLHVKRDGTPNMRYKDNPKVYLTKVYGINILEKNILFSNKEILEDFAEKFLAFIPGSKLNNYLDNEPQEFDFTQSAAEEE